MGVVVAAHHLQLDQLVALKFLLPEAAKNPEVVERFAREARAAAKIESEHVARVLDVGELDAGPYIVMEHLEGENLEELLARNGPLPVVESVHYMLEACDAVAEAHGLGIVHRDLKPSNVFVAERAGGGRIIKLLDFGLVKFLQGAADSNQMSITRTSALMGTPAYMAPEQLRCPREVDTRADIWSLGAVLYETLCGTGPFARGTMPEVCAAILTEAPTPLRSLREGIPVGLEAVVLRCLEKDLDVRYESVAELASDLLLFAPPGAERSIERICRVLRPAGARSVRRRELGPTDVATVRGSRAAIDPPSRRSAWDTSADPFAATKLEPSVAPIAEPIEISVAAPTAASPRLESPRWFSTVLLFGASALFAVGASIFAWTVVSSENGAADTAKALDHQPAADLPSGRVAPPPAAGAAIARPSAAPLGVGSTSAPPASAAPENTTTSTPSHSSGTGAAAPGAGVAAPTPRGPAESATSAARTQSTDAVPSSASAGKPTPSKATSRAPVGSEKRDASATPPEGGAEGGTEPD
jgi:serine/threonine-protein kinase